MARLPDPEIVCTRSQRSQADGRLEIEPVAEALPLIGFKVVVHVGSLFVEHYAVADDRLAVEDDIAMTQGNVDMTRRSPAAARFVVRVEREQEVAFESAGIHADGGLAVMQSERRPVRARLQTSADVRDGICFLVVEGRHVFGEQLRIATTLDTRGETTLHGQLDALLQIALLR